MEDERSSLMVEKKITQRRKKMQWSKATQLLHSTYMYGKAPLKRHILCKLRIKLKVQKSVYYD